MKMKIYMALMEIWNTPMFVDAVALLLSHI